MSNSLWPHGLQHARLPCPSPTSGNCSNSRPLSQWCHPTISSSVAPFSSCLQSSPASGSFLMIYSLNSALPLQFSSVAQLCPILSDPMDYSTLDFPVHHQLLELTQINVHWVADAIQPSHPLLSPSPTFNLSQHQGVFQWVSSLHQVAKVLEFQLQHQSFQWVFRVDFL